MGKPRESNGDAAAKTVKSGPAHEEDEAPYYVFLLTYFGYAVLIFFAHLRDLVGKITQPSRFAYLREQNVSPTQYFRFRALSLTIPLFCNRVMRRSTAILRVTTPVASTHAFAIAGTAPSLASLAGT